MKLLRTSLAFEYWRLGLSLELEINTRFKLFSK
jgi:hypothetical protein